MSKKHHPFVSAWCKHMGSFPYYVETQLRKALKEKAPERAVFYSKAFGRWILLDEVHDKTVRELIEKEAQCV